MGIAVQELLANDFFRDFEVIAGKKGVYKEIQGIAVLEAPDGFKWTRGKELLLSSGYAVMHEPDCIKNAFREGTIQKSSALLIKLGRYLERIPEDVMALCNEHELPLIVAPFSATWMEIISQTNVAVMNRTIRKFQVSDDGGRQITNRSYKEQKIIRILQAVESEMKFPAFMHDIGEDKSYYSSPNFSRMTEYYGLSESDYWEPSKPHTRHTLCDYINMSRYRLIDPGAGDGPRVSWVVMPIKVRGITQGWFGVMEAHGLLDYYDEFAIRIAYLMLQSLYEQISGARDAGYMGFENFIHFALGCGEDETGRIISQAGAQGISMSATYDHAVIGFENISAGEKRETLMKAFASSSASRRGRLAVLGDRELLVLIERERGAGEEAERFREMIEDFMAQTEKLLPDPGMRCGTCRDGVTLRDIRRPVEKCRRAMEAGRVVYPDRSCCDYDDLGPLAWLDIPARELDAMLADYRGLAADERGRELLRTLRVYLENNMNYSVTSELLFVHINTIRKRIDRASELLGTDWHDPVERLCTVLLLQLLEAENRTALR